MECHFPKLGVASLVFLKKWGVSVIYQKKKKQYDNKHTKQRKNYTKTTDIISLDNSPVVHKSNSYWRCPKR